MDKGSEEEGEDEMNGESSMDAYILTYVNSQWEFNLEVLRITYFS